MPAPPTRCPASRSRSAPRPASTWASRAPTSRSPPPSPTASPCACSIRPAPKPRSRCGITTPMSGMPSCRASAQGSPTGTGSAAPGTRPEACGATRPSCSSTRMRRRSAERSRSGRRCSARTKPTPKRRAAWTRRGTCPGAWSWTRRSAGRTTSGPGTGTRTRCCTRSTSRASPCAIPTFPRRCAGPTPAWATRPPSRTCVTSASRPSSCCPYTRTCRRRSWSRKG